MSAISFIELYKLPIDVDHKNVFDLGNYTGDDYYGEIYNFLNSQYQSISIPLFNSPTSINRAFKNTNGEMMITIPKDYSDIKDYNYALLMRGIESGGVVSRVIEKGIFYFVTGFSSDNQNTFSNPGKPTTTLKLKYDSWMNNLDSIYKCDRPQKITRSHIQSYHRNSDTSTVFIPNYIYSENGNYRTIEKSFDYPAYNVYNPEVSSRYKILWLRVWLDGEGLFIEHEDGGAKVGYSGRGCYPSNGAIPIVCIPFALFDIVTQEFISTIKYKYKNETVLYDFCINKSWRMKKTNHIVKADLTFYPPIRYIFDVENNCIVIENVLMKRDNIYIDAGGGAYTPLFYNINSVVIETGYLSIEVDLIHIESKHANNSDFTSLVLDYTKIESNCLIYPSFYYSLFIGGEKQVLLFPYGADYANIHIIAGDINAKYYIEYYSYSSEGDILIKKEKIKSLENQGEIVHINDSFDTYLRNSGNQTIVNGIQQLFNLVTYGAQSIAMPSGKGMIGLQSPAFSAANYAAKLSDIDNSQDSIFLPTVDSLSNAYYQDILMVRKNSINSPFDLYKIAQNQHLYGQEYSIMGRIIRNVKPNFEYLQTENCVMPEITNEIERKEVEEICNKGVTKWHINNLSDTQTKKDIATLNVDVPNKDNALN